MSPSKTSETSDAFRGMPSSTLRHRPINPTTEDIAFVTPRASRTQSKPDIRTTGEATLVKSSQKPSRTATQSSRTSTQPIRVSSQPSRTSTQPIRVSSQPSRINTRTKQPQHMHWSLIVAISMLAMFILLWLGQILWAWGTVTYDDVKYGFPRTMQTDAFVGHETGNIPSHFIALNERGRIEIIELPGGDAAHARIFLGPQLVGNGADLTPITLSFIPSSPHSKLLDMQVSFQGTHILFRNTKGTFVLATN
jgi:hypothetical protein